jgi:hypothetical protein
MRFLSQAKNRKVNSGLTAPTLVHRIEGDHKGNGVDVAFQNIAGIE